MDAARQEELKKEHHDYLSRHPEVKQLLAGFLSEVLLHKPDDVKAFAAAHFAQQAAATTIIIAAAAAPEKAAVSSNSSSSSVASANSASVVVDKIVGEAATVTIAPLVICGPSGVGKGTLISKLKTDFPKIGFTVSHTTRKPREGEQDGVHYHFVSKEAIAKGIENGEFVEHAEVHGNIYGTSYAAVKTLSSNGKICVLDIDVQGVQSVKKTSLDPNVIYIAPPSHEELETRLRARGTESEEDILKRLANAKKEMEWLEQPGNVDHKVVNDDLETAYEELKAKLKELYPTLV